MTRSTIKFNWNSPGEMNPKVDQFLSNTKKWHKELEKLRFIILNCQLTEELKWGVPCYTFQKKNLIAINGLKESCVLAFFKGVLLHDANGILTRPGENIQTGRWIKFRSVNEIAGMEQILKEYIYEAIEVEKTGLKVDLRKNSDLLVPEEFQNKLDKTPALKKAFYALTPGRQRAFTLYFSTPKQSKTRKSRIEKCILQILHGKGLNEPHNR